MNVHASDTMMMMRWLNLLLFWSRFPRFLIFLLLGGAVAASQAAPPGAAPTLTPEFFSVLRRGAPGPLREALNRGAAVNARDAAGNTPLILSAAYGDAACLRLLLDRGAEVNAANAAGATALLRATSDLEMVRLLLERGADVRARSGFGNDALMLAARSAHSHRVVELLLSRGTDARATNNFGATALMAAVAGGDARSVRVLLKHGAEVNAQPGASQLAFVLGGGRSALMWAAFRGDAAMVKLLLDAGADVNVPGVLGTPLSQAAWGDHAETAKLLIERGAKVNQPGPAEGYTALHWAASSEEGNPALVKLLLASGADPNLGGGHNVDAFLDVEQTPLMLARRRGASPILTALVAAGATNGTPDRVSMDVPPSRELPAVLDRAAFRSAVGPAVPRLQATSLESKQGFLRHASAQDCTSCHSQHLPMAALGFAKRLGVDVDGPMQEQLVAMVRQGELKGVEPDWQALFHPDPGHTKGYEIFAFAGQDLPSDEITDAWVNHLAAIQGADGQWFNNLPRPPMQTGDITATALAVQALQRYPLPGRAAAYAKQVQRARRWLWNAKPQNTEGRVYQLLGLAWAGEPARKLQPLAIALLSEQRPNGGWAQLPGLETDAYATGQAIFALRSGAGLPAAQPGVDRALRYLLQTQLADGTWHVRRRAFPFQPTTIKSGFPHGRDSWISTAATSWAVMALSLTEERSALALGR